MTGSNGSESAARSRVARIDTGCQRPTSPLQSLVILGNPLSCYESASGFLALVDRGSSHRVVSVVTWAEIEHGIVLTEEAFQRDLRPWAASVREQFAGATLPLDEAVLVRWKQLLAELKARKRTVACEDSLIAATALHFKHTVLTSNTAHFAPTGVAALNPMA